MSDLEARLERLETMEADRAASWRYAVAIDTVDFELLADAFTADAVLTTRRGSRQGREAVVDYYRTALADPVARKHFLTNQNVTWLAVGEARLESYFIYTFAGEDTSVLGWGNYVDLVRVEDGVGRIAEKTISVDVSADSRLGWATSPDVTP
jgi:hypothetical protein